MLVSISSDFFSVAMKTQPTSAGFLISAISLFLSVSLCCAKQPEPFAGCVLAAANQREVIRAQGYLSTNIPARILIIHSAAQKMNHAVLVYRLNPEGWMVYDDAFGSRRLRPHMVLNVKFPMPLYAARAAYPTWSVDGAWYLDALPLVSR